MGRGVSGGEHSQQRRRNSGKPLQNGPSRVDAHEAHCTTALPESQSPRIRPYFGVFS